MHDRTSQHGMNDEASLTAALRALPDDASTPDAWPALAARVRRRAVVRKTIWFTLPAAFAAGIALAVAWPHIHLQRGMPAPIRIAQPAAPTPASGNAELAALQASSNRWQAWVARLDREGAPLDGRALAQAVSLQDRIGLVDLQLSAVRDPGTAAGLWQQRITLLQRLGLLHLQPYSVAREAHAVPATILL